MLAWAHVAGEEGGFEPLLQEQEPGGKYHQLCVAAQERDGKGNSPWGQEQPHRPHVETGAAKEARLSVAPQGQGLLAGSPVF